MTGSSQIRYLKRIKLVLLEDADTAATVSAPP
jgi:hypothetical protein